MHLLRLLGVTLALGACATQGSPARFEHPAHGVVDTNDPAFKAAAQGCSKRAAERAPFTDPGPKLDAAKAVHEVFGANLISTALATTAVGGELKAMGQAVAACMEQEGWRRAG